MDVTKDVEDNKKPHADIEVAKISGRTSIIIALMTALSGWAIAITTNFDRIFSQGAEESPSTAPVRLRITKIGGTNGLPVSVRLYGKTSSTSGQPVNVNMRYPSERLLYQVGNEVDARDYPVWLDPSSGLPELTVGLWYIYRSERAFLASDKHRGQSANFHLSSSVEFGQIYRRNFRPDLCFSPEVVPEHQLTELPFPEKIPEVNDCSELSEISIEYQFLE